LIVEAEVAYEPRSAIVLGDDSEGGQAKVWDGTCKRVWKDSPESLVDEVNHFFLEKIEEVGA
jgi:hypothetical protein